MANLKLYRLKWNFSFTNQISLLLPWTPKARACTNITLDLDFHLAPRNAASILLNPGYIQHLGCLGKERVLPSSRRTSACKIWYTVKVSELLCPVREFGLQQWSRKEWHDKISFIVIQTLSEGVTIIWTFNCSDYSFLMIKSVQIASFCAFRETLDIVSGLFKKND